jgi:hypothetical protein
MIRFFDSQYSQMVVIRTTRDGESQVHFALSCLTSLPQASDDPGKGSGEKVTFVIRSLAVNSCARTCRDSLQQLFATFFEHYAPNVKAKAGQQQSEAEAAQSAAAIVQTARQNVAVMIENVEL